MTDCNLIAAFNEFGCQSIMIDKFFKHCTKKAACYWVQWITRLYLLHTTFQKGVSSESPPSEDFLKGDKIIGKMIKNKDNLLDTTRDKFAKFNYAFNKFIEFIESLDEGIKFDPTQIYALFYHLLEKPNVDILRSHMGFYSKGSKKNLWESTSVGPRRVYFNECIEKLGAMIDFATPIDNTKISKKLRKQVFDKGNGICDICKKTQITLKKFEAGHIISRAMGGEAVIDNLIPICIDCNRRMGTRHAEEFRRDVYPFA
jgi:hypothetical protein